MGEAVRTRVMRDSQCVGYVRDYPRSVIGEHGEYRGPLLADDKLEDTPGEPKNPLGVESVMG